MQRIRWCVGAAALALLLPTTAQADPKDDARRHFAAGLQAVQDGDLEIALQRFLAAQEAYPHPATLYNIAQTYMDMDDVPNALSYFRLYRDAAPEKAEVVDPLIAAIEARSGAGGVSTPTVGGPAVGTIAAGGGGPVTVVVTGPTDEELARLEALASELDALMAAIKSRKSDDLAAVEAARAGGAAGDGVVDGTPVDGTLPEGGGPLPDLPEGTGFLEGAYDKIVVTASRVGQDPLDSPSTLTVLTSEDVRLMGAQNLGDVLRRVVGVNVMTLASGHADVSIRGFQRKVANKVLILIDGRSTYSDFAGITFINGLPIAMEEIERIEVIRGPGSAVYGANAVTGVVNVITKTPGEIEQRLIKLDAGMPGLARGTVYVNGKTGDTAYRFSAGYQEHGRWSKEVDLVNDQGEPVEGLAVDPFFEDQDTGLKLLRGNGRLDQAFGSKGFASISGGMTTGDLELYNIGALPNFGVQVQSSYLRGDVAWGGLHLRSFWNSDVGYTGPWLEQQGQARTLDAVFDNDAVDVELEGPIEFSTGSVDHTLNLGVGYRYKRIAFGDYMNNIPREEHHVNGFVNEQLAVGIFGFVGSLRVDRHPLLPLTQTISPRSALLLRIFDKTSLRATFGTAFRAPNALESYMDFDLNNPAADGVYIRDLGDSQTLSPERITTVELGVHDESTYFHTADAVVYMNQVHSLIELDAINKEVNVFQEGPNGIEFGQTGWVNIDDTYTGLGAEAELELYPTDGLDVHTNAALQRTTLTSGNDSVPEKSTAGLQLNAGAMYRTPYRIDVTYDLHYVGPQTWRLRGFDTQGGVVIVEEDVDPRLMMSARVGGRPFPDERLELAVTAWNFTELFGDERGFKEHPQGQLVAGRLFGTVAFTF